MPIRRGVCTASQLLQNLHKSLIRHPARNLSTTCLCLSKKNNRGPDDEGPVQFSTSRAASWSMTSAVMAPKRDVPWYQPFSVIGSLCVFLIYFSFLREENDLDIELNYSLFERVPQLEEQQLKLVIDHARQQGKDTKELEKRLAEVQAQKQTVSS